MPFFKQSGGAGQYVSVKSFGATGNGNTDDTVSIQAAIDAVALAGGGVVYFPTPSANYKITATLIVEADRVYLVGGTRYPLTSPSPPQGGCVIRWRGAAGGTMVEFRAGAAATYPVLGGGMEGFTLYGNTSNLAGVGLSLKTVRGVIIRDLSIRAVTIAGIDIGVSSPAGVAVSNNDNRYLQFEAIDINVGNAGDGIGLRVDGPVSSATGGGCTGSIFQSVNITHRDGVGIQLRAGDNNFFYGTILTRPAGAGIGIEILGLEGGVVIGSDMNTFFGIQPSQGGITARASITLANPRRMENFVYGYQVTDAAQPDPVVELGAQLYVTRHGAGSGSVGIREYTRMAKVVQDDFIGGISGAGSIGELGWTRTLVGTGAVARQAAIAGRPGIYRLDTGATINSLATVHLDTVTMLPADNWEAEFFVRLNVNDANTQVRIGLGDAPSGDPPADGCYIEKLGADVNWFGVTRAAAAQNRTASLGAVSTNWLRVKIRRKDSTTIAFMLDDPDFNYPTEILATATIPASALTMFVQVKCIAAASKTLDLDFAGLVVQGLAR
jgi:hypothetical protein